MIKLKPILENRSNASVEYGCVMLSFNIPHWNRFIKLIDTEDLYTESNSEYGIETETHVTLLYGLEGSVSVMDVSSVTNDIVYGQCLFHNVSTFESEKYEVLKFDVSYATRGGAFLHKSNTQLKNLPHTVIFPKYNPHMTIAYLKTGTAKKYINKFKDLSFKSTPTGIIYSKANGDKLQIPINVTKSNSTNLS